MSYSVSKPSKYFKVSRSSCIFLAAPVKFRLQLWPVKSGQYFDLFSFPNSGIITVSPGLFTEGNRVRSLSKNSVTSNEAREPLKLPAFLLLLQR